MLMFIEIIQFEFTVVEISVCFSWALHPQLFNISFSLFAVSLFIETHLLWQEKPEKM